MSDERGFAVPFTVRDQTLQLFASRPSIVRIVSDDRERILSLTLPDVAEFRWKPPAAHGGRPSCRKQICANVNRSLEMAGSSRRYRALR